MSLAIELGTAFLGGLIGGVAVALFEFSLYVFIDWVSGE